MTSMTHSHDEPGHLQAPPPSDAPPQLVAQPDKFSLWVGRLWSSQPKWLAPLALFGCVAGASAYVMVSDPTDGRADAVPTCIVKLTTGFACPGCGGTRAFWYLLHANFPAAARHHLPFLFAVPFLVYIYIAWAGKQLFRWRLPQLRLSPATIGFFLLAWLAFTVIRNLPWAPFTWLAV